MKKTLIVLAILASAGSAYAQATGFGVQLFIWPQWTHSKTNAVSGSTVTETIGQIINTTHTFGTNGTVLAPQMTALVRQSGTLTNGASVTLNLSSIANSFGDTVAFASVQFLAVKSQSQTNNTDALIIGNAASNQFAAWAGSATDAVKVYPGGIFVAYAPSTGYAVSTNPYLKIANSGTNSLIYEAHIAGK